MQRFYQWLIVVSILVIFGSGVFTTFASSAQAPGQAPAAAPARETYAELPGVRVWFKDTGGSGVPVVFLHAASGSSQVWEHQIPAFTGGRIPLHRLRSAGMGPLCD